MAKQKVCIRCGEVMEEGEEDRKCRIWHAICVPCKRGEYPTNPTETGIWRGFAIVDKATKRIPGGLGLRGSPLLSNTRAELQAQVGPLGEVVEIVIQIVKK